MLLNFNKFLIFTAFLMTIGCTHLFMHPDRLDYSINWQNKDDFVEDIYIMTADGFELHSWYIHKPENKKPKGIIVQVHGNAQNLTSHYYSLIWLIDYGYDVYTFDYRGYGMSEGEKDIFASPKDVAAALNYASKVAKAKNLPLVFYGQSLGGSLLLKTLKDQPDNWQPKLIVIESSFHTFQGIAREKMADGIITWPFQWLVYPLVSSRLDPGGADLVKLEKFPKLLIYSENDPIVSFRQGKKLFDNLTGQKELWTYPEFGHVAYHAIRDGKLQKKLADYFDHVILSKAKDLQ